MHFLVDECTGPVVARWLKVQGHDVFSIYEQARGMDDESVFRKAFKEDWILITNDKDFGERVYRERLPHNGVILLRLNDERSAIKIEVLENLLSRYADRIPGRFVVVTERKIRFARTSSIEIN